VKNERKREKNIYGIHQYTLTRRRKIRGKKSKGTSNENQTKKKGKEKKENG
jgi:hypothetical protein